jgi:opacity protein-like surface antigen
MSNNEDWLKIIKERVDNYESPVPKDLWSSIERDLPKKSPVTLYLKRTAAAIASIAAIAAIIITVRFANTNNPQKHLISSANTNIIDEAKKQSENKDIVIETQEVKENLAQNITNEKQANIPVVSTYNPDSISDKPATANIHSAIADNDKSANNGNNSRLKAIKEFNEAAKMTENHANGKDISLPAANNNDRRWSIAMAVNNGFGNRNSSANGFAPINNAYAVNKYSSRPDQKMGHFNYVYSSVVANNIEEETKTEIEYDIPLTYAAMFRYHFNNHWAIDAGIQFSHLGASWHSGSNNSYYSSTQKLVLIGIPVGASFTFVDSRFFTMYALAGASVDKCVTGNIKRFAQSGRKHANTGKRNLPEHPWQFSLNAGLGLQFNATDHIGIFAEPKATRFFDTAKELNIRKHSTEFQLLVGLRLTY